MNIRTLKFKKEYSGYYKAKYGSYTISIERQYNTWIGTIRDENQNWVFSDDYYSYSDAKTFLDSEVQSLNKKRI